MIRTLAILLTAAVLLTFCGCGDTSLSADTDTTTIPTTETTTMQPDDTTTETTTTTAPVIDEVALEQQAADEDVEAFFSSWKSGDVEALTASADNETIAAMLIDKVTISDYSITHHPSSEEPKNFWYRVRLVAERSTLASVPVGESDWWVLSGRMQHWYGIHMFPLDKDPVIEGYLSNYQSLTPLTFCCLTSTELKWFETIHNVSALSKTTICEKGGLLARIYAQTRSQADPTYDPTGFVPADELTLFAEQMLGVKGVEFSACSTYTTDKDGKALVEMDYYGGEFAIASPLSVTQKGDRYTVEIRYYADIMYLIEAVTMRYVVEETDDGYRLLSCQKIRDNNLPPRFYSM